MKAQADLVLEGGGVKGIGLVGAVARLDRDLRFERVAGSSVGALVAALVAAGYDGDELHATLLDFPFGKVRHRSGFDEVPLIGPASSLVMGRGIYDTTFVRDWLADRLERRDVRTFGDLRHADSGSAFAEARRFRLVVTATDVTSGELLYLPWNYGSHFGLDPDAQLVADAVAASIAIPFYFDPLHLTDVRTNRTHTLVDGGVLSNFPITVFDRSDGEQPRWPTFGVKIVPQLPSHDAEMIPIAGRIHIAGVRQLESVVATMIAGRDQTYLERPCVAMRTMQVDTHEVSIVDFGVDDATKQLVFANGWNEADRFLAGWSWPNYLARCGTRRE
ncbi:MAG TPA: patatin-like phospholipase family protein [Acidimicrobiia bacterium]|nr:patatin-like phospholipase family protein [Acidimicrobiia bacterium]